MHVPLAGCAARLPRAYTRVDNHPAAVEKTASECRAQIPDTQPHPACRPGIARKIPHCVARRRVVLPHLCVPETSPIHNRSLLATACDRDRIRLGVSFCVHDTVMILVW